MDVSNFVVPSVNFGVIRVGRWSLLITISIIAIAVRLAPLTRSDLSFAYYPDDSFQYIQLADGMHDGCGFARLINRSCQTPEILRTPGYPVFLAAIGRKVRSFLAAQAVIGGIVGLAVAVWLMQEWSFFAAITA
jgi:hypothetical protein